MSQTPASGTPKPASRITIDPREVVARVRSCLPESTEPIAIHEPRFLGREREYVLDCIDSTWVSYGGSYVGRFEAALAQACRAADVISVSSGTVALQMALELFGLRRGDEVLVPALTFVASANAVVHAGGVPHFVDVNETTLGIDVGRLRQHLEKMAERRSDHYYNRASGQRIAAVLPVHVFGHPVDMDPLQELARDYGLFIVEDAAEALGSRYKDRLCGSLAPIAALSFNGNKVVTTGGGGAIVTADRGVAERARALTTTSKRPHPWDYFHDEVAYNFRLPNINAALGLAQLEQLDQRLRAKRRLWARYRDTFADFKGARIFQDAPFAESNHWLVALVLNEAIADQLGEILAALHGAGVRARPAWTPMHELPMYRQNPRMALPVAESLASRIVNLPSSPHLYGPA